MAATGPMRLKLLPQGFSLFSFLRTDFLASPVKSVTPVLKGMTFVKLGNFENVPAPVFEGYMKDKQSFEKAWEGIGHFEVMPPPAG